jgi:hypothetical protein
MPWFCGNGKFLSPIVIKIVPSGANAMREPKFTSEVVQASATKMSLASTNCLPSNLARNSAVVASFSRGFE